MTAANEDEEKAAYEERVRERLVILKVIESLQAVRYGPDGKIDLDTVDGLVRALALTVEHIKYREESKNAIVLWGDERVG